MIGARQIAAGTVGVAVIALAVVALLGSPGGPAGSEPDRAPRIYGDTAPRASSTVDEASEARRLARRWALAWTTASTCGDPEAVRRVVALSSGSLRDSLLSQPPRPVAGVACVRRPRVVSVLLVPHGNGRLRAIVERPGEAGGDAHLELEIRSSAAGLRVSTLDY